MRSAKEYRAISKQQLGNEFFGRKWLFAILALLIYSALISVITTLASFVNELYGSILGGIISVLITGPLTYSLVKIFMLVVKNAEEKANLNYLFDGFKGKFQQTFVTSLLQNLYTFLWSLLFVIPGIVKMYSYSATMYLVYERDLSGNEAITVSRRLMNGKKMKLFLLDLSFIGWYIIGLLCLGIGTLWVEAHHTMARADFFNDLLQEPEVVDVY